MKLAVALRKHSASCILSFFYWGVFAVTTFRRRRKKKRCTVCCHFLVHVIAMWSSAVSVCRPPCFPLHQCLQMGKMLCGFGFHTKKPTHTHTYPEHLHVKSVRLWCVNSGRSGVRAPTPFECTFHHSKAWWVLQFSVCGTTKPEWLAAFSLVLFSCCPFMPSLTRIHISR